jgi:hypothetical protein
MRLRAGHAQASPAEPAGQRVEIPAAEVRVEQGAGLRSGLPRGHVHERTVGRLRAEAGRDEHRDRAGQGGDAGHLPERADRVGEEGQPFTGQRGGHGLVDQREPGVGQSLAYPDQPELRRGDQLEIHVASRPGHPHRPPGELLGLVQVGHPVGPGQPHPAVHRPGVERLQQPFGPDHPAVGRGEVREVRLVGDRQPHRASRLFPPPLGQGGGAVGGRSGRCHASIVTGSARR